MQTFSPTVESGNPAKRLAWLRECARPGALHLAEIQADIVELEAAVASGVAEDSPMAREASPSTAASASWAKVIGRINAEIDERLGVNHGA